jgi:hypothetical protein
MNRECTRELTRIKTQTNRRLTQIDADKTDKTDKTDENRESVDATKAVDRKAVQQVYIRRLHRTCRAVGFAEVDYADFVLRRKRSLR